MPDTEPLIEEADPFDIAPVRLTVDLTALAENWVELSKRSGRARTGAVVKADAYGLGIEDCGLTLYEAGARDFFVAAASEGATLRAYAPDARIFVLSGIWPGQERLFLENDLVPVLASEEQMTHWMSVIAEVGAYPCAVQVDTGFNRLGLSFDDAMALAQDVSRPTSFDPVLVLSHLHTADAADAETTRNQLDLFQQVSAAFEGVESSLSASAGIFLGPRYHFDLTRPGIALYGGKASLAMDRPLRTVATAEARIVQIRDAKAGETVSYGGTHRLLRDSRLAVASVGYADGYMRSLSGSGVPLRNGTAGGAAAAFDGYKLPVLGRITMDLTVFDATDLPSGALRTGDYVELVGPNMPLDDVAEAGGTIGYELLTGFGLRYEGRYTGDEV